jgi:hypothetical protein
MSSQSLGLLSAQHPGSRAECFLEFSIIEPSIPACDDKDDMVPDAKCQGLGNACSFNPKRSGGFIDGRNALAIVDSPKVGGVAS